MERLYLEPKYSYALIAGSCAAWGSICGKLSGLFSGELSISNIDQLFLKAVFVIIMLTSNAAVWTYYVKALQASSTSIVPTVISTACNYVFSALAGIIIFNERISFLWCCGMLLVIAGLALITQSDCNRNENVIETRKEK